MWERSIARPEPTQQREDEKENRLSSMPSLEFDPISVFEW